MVRTGWLRFVYLDCERRSDPIKVYPEPPLGGEQTMDDTFLIHLKLTIFRMNYKDSAVKISA